MRSVSLGSLEQQSPPLKVDRVLPRKYLKAALALAYARIHPIYRTNREACCFLTMEFGLGQCELTDGCTMLSSEVLAIGSLSR